MEETEQCENCQRKVPSSNMTIHQAHCIRNLTVCSICQESVNVEQIVNHYKEHNKMILCPDCKSMVKQQEFDEHCIVCEQRLCQCQFCDIELRASEMNDHNIYCGARTERCPTCNELVMYKYQSLHLESNHTFLKLNDEPGPSASWEINERKEKQQEKLPNAKSNLRYDCFNKRSFDSEKTNKNQSKVLVKNDLDLPKKENTIISSESKGAIQRMKQSEPTRPKKKRQAPTPPSLPSPQSLGPQNLTDSTSDSKNVLLPCEHCQNMIPISKLVFHETFCQAELLKYLNTVQNQRINNRKEHLTQDEREAIKQNSTMNESTDEAKLPCEFCFRLYSASVLLQHQKKCGIDM